jgi:PAS domain-containing protein
MNGSQFRLVSGVESPRVLYLDTEQKQSDVKLIVTDVIQMTGLDATYVDDHLQVYALRRRDFNLLLDDMRLLIGDYQPQVVIVDGIVEFVASFNDESMAKQLIHELLCISEERRLAMVCVLHTNKADDDHNMRGHLGTMLAQKAGTVLECKKDRGSSVITVTCSDARHAEMPDWSIMFNEDGCIVDADERRRQALEQHRADLQQKRQEATEQKQKERLDYALMCIRDHGGSISRKQLTEILVKKFEVERTTVSRFLTTQIDAKALYEVNKMIQASDDLALAF